MKSLRPKIWNFQAFLILWLLSLNLNFIPRWNFENVVDLIGFPDVPKSFYCAVSKLLNFLPFFKNLRWNSTLFDLSFEIRFLRSTFVFLSVSIIWFCSSFVLASNIILMDFAVSVPFSFWGSLSLSSTFYHSKRDGTKWWRRSEISDSSHARYTDMFWMKISVEIRKFNRLVFFCYTGRKCCSGESKSCGQLKSFSWSLQPSGIWLAVERKTYGSFGICIENKTHCFFSFYLTSLLSTINQI